MTKKLLIIFCIFASFFTSAQTTFSDQEIVKLDSLIQYYEQNDSIQSQSISLLDNQLGLYKQQVVLDSTLLFYKDQELQLLNNRVSLYIELNKEIKPKWYDKKWIWFTLGCVTITTSAYVLDKVN
jgi:hypothetical protein